MLPLDGRTRMTTQLTGNADGSAGSRSIHAPAAAGLGMRSARIESVQPDSSAVSNQRVAKRRWQRGVAGRLLRRVASHRAHHGQAFAALTRIVRHAEADRTPRSPSRRGRPAPGFRIHPVMLDAALQSMAAAMPAERWRRPLKSRICRCLWRRSGCSARSAGTPDATRSWWTSTKPARASWARVILTDDAGTPTAEITGIYLRRVNAARCRCRWSRRSSIPPGWKARRRRRRPVGCVARKLAGAGRRANRVDPRTNSRTNGAHRSGGGDHRGPRRRVRGAGGLRRNRRGSRASAGRCGGLRPAGPTDMARRRHTGRGIRSGRSRRRSARSSAAGTGGRRGCGW